MKLIAYTLGARDLEIVPSESQRDWMDRTPSGFAKRCLPLLMANQCGWVLLNNEGFTVEYKGGRDALDLKIEYDNPEGKHLALSHFGSGIVTWSIPYLFRTEPGVHLWVRGPVNLPKDGAQALEGVVETDWANATFTMNWMITRKDHPVRFEAGEPICMVVPMRLGDLESTEPEVMPLSKADPQTLRAFLAFRDSRAVFNHKLHTLDEDTTKQGWQKNYFQRKDHADNETSLEHRTKLHLKPFEEK